VSACGEPAARYQKWQVRLGSRSKSTITLTGADLSYIVHVVEVATKERIDGENFFTQQIN
jgi:hypothetical protein